MNKQEILVSGHASRDRLARQLGRWLVALKLKEEWAVTSAPADALEKRGTCPPITILKTENWPDQEIYHTAERLAHRHKAQTPSCFFIFYHTNPRLRKADLWVDLLPLFPEPSKIEIATGAEEMRRTLGEVIWKYQAELMRPASDPHRSIRDAVKSFAESVRSLEQAGMRMAEVVQSAGILPDQERDELAEDLRKLTTPPAFQGPPAPRPSPLDNVEEIVRSTMDLRDESGKLSAHHIRNLFGVSLRTLAELLGRTPQAVSKTPNAASLQDSLSFFERIARLRRVLQDDSAFRKWLLTPNPRLGERRPMEFIKERQWQAIADLVDDILTGAPG